MQFFGKRRMFYVFTIVSVIIFSSAKSQTAVALKEVGKHAGEELSVCGTVLSIKDLENVKNKPTLINLGSGVEHLDVIVANQSTLLFGLSQDSLLNKNVCINGRIHFFVGTNNTYLKAESIQMSGTEVIVPTVFKNEPAVIKDTAHVAATMQTRLKKEIELYRNKPDPVKKALLMKYMKMGHIVSFSQTREKKTYIILIKEHQYL